ncbi:MAG TPA: hypothetical protein VGB76_02610, partial [Pyrinomonadaceae bacterium]
RLAHSLEGGEIKRGLEVWFHKHRETHLACPPPGLPGERSGRGVSSCRETSSLGAPLAAEAQRRQVETCANLKVRLFALSHGARTQKERREKV